MMFQSPQQEIQVLMIDFGACSCKSKETDSEWAISNAHQGEQGEFVYHMNKVFVKHNFEWCHEKNNKYKEYTSLPSIGACPAVFISME